MLRWVDEHAPDQYVDWYPFDHPQLGPVELGGWHHLGIWTNPPPERLRDEVAPHAEFAVAQALASPCLRVRHHRVVDLGRRDVAGRGRRRQHRLAADLRLGAGAEGEPRAARSSPSCSGDGATSSAARPGCSSASSRAGRRPGSPSGHDGTPDRVLATWVVRAEAGTPADRDASPTSGRAGSSTLELTDGAPGGRPGAGRIAARAERSRPPPTPRPSSRTRRSPSSARSPPSALARCCCSRAARTPSSCSTSPTGRSGRRASRSR